MGEVKRMDIYEFQERGYLQEINRRLLHPLGLALEIRVEKCKACNGTGFMEDGPAGATYSAPCTYCRDGYVRSLGGVWDYRDDPEGIYFAGEYVELAEKASRIQAEWDARADARRAALGYIIQSTESEGEQ